MKSPRRTGRVVDELVGVSTWDLMAARMRAGGMNVTITVVCEDADLDDFARAIPICSTLLFYDASFPSCGPWRVTNRDARRPAA